MSEKYKFYNEEGIYFITPTIVNWIDLFTRQAYSELVLDSNKMLEQRLFYLHNNPVEQGIVFRAEDYVYSSAIDYCDGKGLLDIAMIE